MPVKKLLFISLMVCLIWGCSSANRYYRQHPRYYKDQRKRKPTRPGAAMLVDTATIPIPDSMLTAVADTLKPYYTVFNKCEVANIELVILHREKSTIQMAPQTTRNINCDKADTVKMYSGNQTYVQHVMQSGKRYFIVQKENERCYIEDAE